MRWYLAVVAGQFQAESLSPSLAIFLFGKILACNAGIFGWHVEARVSVCRKVIAAMLDFQNLKGRGSWFCACP